MKSEEIIMLVFVCVIMLAVPFIFWMIRQEEKRRKAEENQRWLEQKRKQNESAKK